jgi:hypothetical protein
LANRALTQPLRHIETCRGSSARLQGLSVANDERVREPDDIRAPIRDRSCHDRTVPTVHEHAD